MANLSIEVIKKDGGEHTFTYEQLQEEVQAFCDGIAPGTPTKVEIMEGEKGPFAVIVYGTDLNLGTGAQGEQGEPGPQGEQGEPGLPGDLSALYMGTFVGGDGAGAPLNLPVQTLKNGITPNPGDTIYHLFAVETATGAALLPPVDFDEAPGGSDFDAILIDDGGTVITQNAVDRKSVV